MTHRNVLENKLSTIQKYLQILKSYQKYSLSEIESDLTLRGAIERYLYLVVQSTIDLAEGYVSYRRFRKPTSQREAFDILQEEKVIPLPLCEKLSQMVGFRNIVAHDYERVDLGIVSNILQLQLSDIEEFLATIQNRL